MTKTSTKIYNQQPSIADLTLNLGRSMRWHITLSSLVLSLFISVFIVIFHVNERLTYMFKGLESHYAQLLAGGDIFEVTRNLKSLQKSEAFSAAWLIDNSSKKILASVEGEEVHLQSYATAKSLIDGRNFAFIGLRPYFMKMIKIKSPATKKSYVVECLSEIPLAPIFYSVLIVLVMFLIVGEYFKSIFATLGERLTIPLTQFVQYLREATNVNDEIGDRVSKADSYLELVELSNQLSAFQQRAAKAESFAKNAARLAAIGETTSAIAHDIKEPLHSIKKIASSPMSEFRQKAMMSSIKEIDLLVQDLLDYSRPYDPQNNENKSTATNQELRGLIDSINQIQAIGKAKPDVSIQFEPDVGTSNIVTAIPPLHFRRIVKNILDNALAALEDREDKKLAPLIKVEVKVDGNNAEIVVANNGPSLKSDEIASIFEPFRSSRLGKGGTGLGLAIVKKLVTDVSGSVQAANQAGLVVFSIRLPIYFGGPNVH